MRNTIRNKLNRPYHETSMNETTTRHRGLLECKCNNTALNTDPLFYPHKHIWCWHTDDNDCVCGTVL